MGESLKQDVDHILDIRRAQNRERRALHILLKNLHDQKDHHLALQVNMGGVSSYLISVTLQWVRTKVGFAAHLPIFCKAIQQATHAPSETSTLTSWNAETVRLFRQGQPDWRRQREMAAYLMTRQHHKFPPLLLVGYQKWIFDKRDDKWGIDGIAMDDSLTLAGLESTGTYWDFNDAETQFYALDGQHRLMAVLGLHELIQTGQLLARDKNGKPKRSGELSCEDIINRIHGETGDDCADIHERIQHLMDESIGIEIMPAVCQGETYGGALQRLTQIFIDVNQSAKRSTKSQGPKPSAS